MDSKDNDVLEIIRYLGITPEELERRFPEFGGGIDWERVEKNKQFLKLFFPHPRALIGQLDEAVEDTNERLNKASNDNTAKITELYKAIDAVAGHSLKLERRLRVRSVVITIALATAAAALFFAIRAQ